jgi:tRNA dimethylallyltransferase
MTAAKTVIVIAGPTAVGKTAVALAVAKHFNTEIISADSRQCYKELNIGVARPAPEELALVPHHFIASHSISQKITAAFFEQYALEKVHELFKNSDVVVLTGGTGLYIAAFCDGLDPVPQVPEAVHRQVIADYTQNGLPWLQQQLQQLDPLFFATGETANPQRLMRALEVFKATGVSIRTFRRGIKATRDFNIQKIALHLPKEQLHQNIESRVDAMVANRLIEEVKSLKEFQHYNALQTVGYKEIFAFLNGEMGREEAITQIKKNTKQYAKRQLTWFRKDAAYTWLPPQPEAVLSFLKNALQHSR